jgi:hypothetical protein
MKRSSMSRTPIFCCLPAVLLALLLGACGSEETPANAVIPAATDAGGGDAATTDATPDAQNPPLEAGPPVRTVETRPRFGTLDPGNLLLDGDFELSGPDALQYPWFQFTAANVALGMQCHSGLRCAHLEPGELIAGVFMWPDGPVEAGFYARIQGKSCDSEAVGYITPIQSYLGAPNPTQLKPVSSGPDKDGYCHYTASASVPFDTGNSFWTLIIGDHKSATGSITVDDAVIRAQKSGAASALSASGPPTAETMAIVESARDAYAKRPPVPPRATPAPVFDRTGRLRATRGALSAPAGARGPARPQRP